MASDLSLDKASLPVGSLFDSFCTISSRVFPNSYFFVPGELGEEPGVDPSKVPVCVQSQSKVDAGLVVISEGVSVLSF